MVEDHGDGRGGDGQRIAVGRGDQLRRRAALNRSSPASTHWPASKREAGAASA